METKKSLSVLKLEKLVFDELSFHRIGIVSSSQIEFRMGVSVDQREELPIYRVILTLDATKEKEYTIKIVLSGFFSFEADQSLTEEKKNKILTQNAVAILMPYMRSEVSLLTAQPNTECVVLPPFNITNMFNDKNQQSEISDHQRA